MSRSEAAALEWTRFANGHWQKEMPEREGQYPTADRFSGEIGQTFSVMEINGKLVGSYDFVHACGKWGGWWWSEPMPALPKPPKW